MIHFSSELVSTVSALLVAMILDMLLRIAPQLRDYVRPFFGIPSRFAMRLDRKLNRSERSVAVRRSRGMISLVIILVLGGLFATGVFGLMKFNANLQPLVWFILMRVTHPWTVTFDVIKALKNKDSVQAKTHLTRRQVHVSDKVDTHGMIRQLLEEMAVSFVYGFWVPVFYGLVAAAAGYSALMTAVVVCFITEATRTLTADDKYNQPFVQGFVLVNQVITFIPARIAALFFVLASLFTPRAKPIAALQGMFSQGSAHLDPNVGWVVAAIAHALHVSLPSHRGQNWIGHAEASARAELSHLQSGLWLHSVTFGIVFLVLVMLLFLAIAS